MLRAFALILAMLFAGETLETTLALPVPGPVLGLGLLFLLLRTRGDGDAPDLDAVASGLIRLLPLFFVPAGVGVMVHGTRLWSDGIGLFLAVFPATLLALAFTAWLFVRLTGPGEER